MSDETLIALVRCALTPGVGGRVVRQLIARFGDLPTALCAPGSWVRELVPIGSEAAAALSAVASRDAAIQEIDRVRDAGYRFIVEGELGYPARLSSLYDPPFFLTTTGPIPFEKPALAIVGPRKPTPYGQRQAYRFSKRVAEAGVTVVSGMALGVDGIAHQGALDGGGTTVAILGSGLGRIYPVRHRNLAREIAAAGAVVSEHLFGVAPLPHHFPRRNRIISGLSDAVLIVEASEKSGSLITATWALEQGRDVFAIPGPVDRPESAGTNRLIQQGAALVTDPEEVLDLLGVKPAARPAAQSSLFGEGSIEDALLRSFDTEPERHLDDLVAAARRPAHEVFAALTRLELGRRVRRYPGRVYALVD